MLAFVCMKDDEVRPGRQSVGVQKEIRSACREVSLVKHVDLRSECIVHHKAA